MDLNKEEKNDKDEEEEKEESGEKEVEKLNINDHQKKEHEKEIEEEKNIELEGKNENEKKLMKKKTFLISEEIEILIDQKKGIILKEKLDDKPADNKNLEFEDDFIKQELPIDGYV